MKVSDYFLFILDDFNTKKYANKAERTRNINRVTLFGFRSDQRAVHGYIGYIFTHVFTLLILQYDSLTIDNLFRL